MGFLDTLGSMLGKMAAKGQEINGYKADYQFMDNQQLWQEYCSLKSMSGEVYENRCSAVKLVLKEHLESEYEQMNNEKLKRIYTSLENKPGEQNRMKCKAAEKVLRKRGYSLE